MELATNQFTKGLQLDTHPMVLGSDSLSDALNATFVTMNGNEIILQNDMGNRKVDNAFLPAGYLPLGIKEYGGIIYVAAYNPLTNKGLIGSFPSPQRKIDNKDESYSLNLEQFIEQIESGKYKLVKDYFIIPISEEVLHVGDKFSIYAATNNNSQLIDLINNYTTKISDLKNSLFTIQIGILNSLNEFIDISNKLINDNGYYISMEDRSGEFNNYPEDDRELMIHRSKLAINTFSLKTSSKLYLKTIINHISNVSYRITGIKQTTENNEKTYTFDLEVTYLYNCRDGSFPILFYYKNKNNGNYEMYDADSINKAVLSDEEYLEEYELYSKTIKYTIFFDPKTKSIGNNILDYKIEFLLDHSNNSNTYNYYGNSRIVLTEFTKEGSLDLNKLGSNLIEFKGYKYYNDIENKTTTLEINVVNYPIDVNSYLKFNISILNSDIHIDPISVSGSGVYSVKFNYPENGKLYKIKFLEDEGEYLYLTTPIFNGNYVGKEYKEFNNGIYDYSLHKNMYILDFRSIKKIKLNPIVECTVKSKTGEKNTTFEGKYAYREGTPTYNSPITINGAVPSINNYYKVIDSFSINNTLLFTPQLSNLEIYPDNIIGLLEIDLSNINIINREIEGEKLSYNNTKYNYSTDLINSETEVSENIINLSEEIIKHLNNPSKLDLVTSILVNNMIKGNLEDKNISISHVITPLYDFILKYYKREEKYSFKSPYICVDFDNTDNCTIKYSDTPEDLIGNDINNSPLEGKLQQAIYDGFLAQDYINNYILSLTDNLFIVDYNINDHILGYYPCVYGEEISLQRKFHSTVNKGNGYVRIWMRVNNNEYTPIFACYRSTEGDPSIQITHSAVSLGLDKIIRSVPHLYEYSYGEKFLTWSVINPYLRTKEFLVKSNITFEYSINFKDIANVNNKNYSENFKNIVNDCFELNKNYSGSKTIEEGIIESNEEFLEEINTLLEGKIECALIWDGDIYIRDLNGKYLDPTYVYYWNDKSHSCMKSYKANKFYLKELDSYFPELKSCNELYYDNSIKENFVPETLYTVEGQMLGNTTFNYIYSSTMLQIEGGASGSYIGVTRLPLNTKNIITTKSFINNG